MIETQKTILEDLEKQPFEKSEKASWYDLALKVLSAAIAIAVMAVLLAPLFHR